ncbi:hypothetical protein V8E54_008004 [Elaphomyces granulatus]
MDQSRLDHNDGSHLANHDDDDDDDDDAPEKTLLGPFVDCVDDFRLTMKKYSVVICGSTVLHLFSQSKDWTTNDLDLFVSRDSLGEQGQILWHVFLTSVCKYNLCDDADGLCPPDVQKFVYKKDDRVIDLAILPCNPIEFHIERFYGTHVLNYATWNIAYSLFPRLSLRDRKMVVFHHLPYSALLSFDKYRHRGFEYITIQDACLRYPELDQLRSTGDAHCEVMPFSSIELDATHLGEPAANPSIIWFRLTEGKIRVCPKPVSE